MTVKQLQEKLNLQFICNEKLAEEKNVTGCYCGDLLSWVMTRLKRGSIWVTVMNNVNVIAVASLADASCVILAENSEIAPEVLERAAENRVNVLRSSETSYEICRMLGTILNA